MRSIHGHLGEALLLFLALHEPYGEANDTRNDQHHQDNDDNGDNYENMSEKE